MASGAVPAAGRPSLVRHASSATSARRGAARRVRQAAAASLYRLGARGPVPVTPGEGRTRFADELFPQFDLLFFRHNISPHFFTRCNIAAQTGWRLQRGSGLRRLARDTREQARGPACQTPVSGHGQRTTCYRICKCDDPVNARLTRCRRYACRSTSSPGATSGRPTFESCSVDPSEVRRCHGRND